MSSSTLFPAVPGDVAMLTATEFAFGLECNNPPSLEEVCRRFGNDSNRALVWMIRFRALKTWFARDGIAQCLSAARMPHICEVAASFELNAQWEFDSAAFCLAVDLAANRRSRLEVSEG